jgi:hypothetical protein
MSRAESLNDVDLATAAAAEADLRRLLAIQPSIEFVPRVRARVAAEPAAVGWRRPLIALTCASICALVVVLTLCGGPEVQNASRTGIPAVSLRPDIVLESQSRGAEPAAPRHAAAARRDRRERHGPQVGRAAPIVIDPTLAQAIRRMMASPQTMTVNSTLKSAPASIAGEVPALFVAEPLDVPELVLRSADEPTGRQ